MTTTPPLFSIIIPTYNHGHLIGRCLDSLVSQSYTNWEAIVVNNYSEDDTIAVVERYADPRIRLVNFSNGGIIAASRNRGIEEARGEWICFLDSDDWWTPDKLTRCLPLLPQSDLLYHDMHIIRGQTGSLGRRTRLRGRDLNPDSAFKDMLLHGNPIINSSVVIHTALIQKLGAISEDKELVAVEDFDYWLRAAQAKARLTYIPEILGYYWIGGSNMSVNIRQYWRISALMRKVLKGLNPVFISKVERRLYFIKGRILHLAGYPRRARVFYCAALGGGYTCKALIFYLLSWFRR